MVEKVTMDKTRDFGQFKTIEGNRQTQPAHLKALIKAIEAKNLLAEFPIVVNEDMEIIDGQHRLMAAAHLNLPIYYTVVKGLTLKNVMSINTASKSWGIWDFVNSYASQGNPDYAELKDFCNKYGLNASVGAALLEGRGKGGGSVSRRIRSGEFSISVRQRAAVVAELLQEMQPHAEFKLAADRKFIWALWDLLNEPDFDANRLLSKLRTHGLKISKRVNERYYTLEIEELYNFYAQEPVTLYRGQPANAAV